MKNPCGVILAMILMGQNYIGLNLGYSNGALDELPRGDIKPMNGFSFGIPINIELSIIRC